MIKSQSKVNLQSSVYRVPVPKIPTNLMPTIFLTISVNFAGDVFPDGVIIKLVVKNDRESCTQIYAERINIQFLG